MKKLFLFQALMACLCIPSFSSCSDQEPDAPSSGTTPETEEEQLIPKLVKSSDVDVKFYRNGNLLAFREDIDFDLHFDWMNYSMKSIYELPLPEGKTFQTYRVEAKNVRFVKTEILKHSDDPSYDEAAELALISTKQIDEDNLEIYVTPSQLGTIYKVYYSMEVEDWYSRPTTITNSITFVTFAEDIYPDYFVQFSSYVYQDDELILQGFWDATLAWSDDRPQAFVGPEGGKFRIVLDDLSTHRSKYITDMQIVPDLFYNGEEMTADDVEILQIEKNEYEVSIKPSDRVRSVMIRWTEYDKKCQDLYAPCLVVFQNHLQYTENTAPALLGRK